MYNKIPAAVCLLLPPSLSLKTENIVIQKIY